MRVVLCFALVGLQALLTGCHSGRPDADTSNSKTTPTTLKILIDVQEPFKSTGVLNSASQNRAFTVGYGKYGISCENTAFTEGMTPIGKFRVNAIMGENRFEMEPSLVEKSGKTMDYLKENLFDNMSAIDFKGDGRTMEYGKGYISLAPLSSTVQPFEFNEYAGKFRWYSFAIHGTNDEKRVGQQITGGCLNVAASDLDILLETVQLGDVVEVTANGPCDV